MKTLFYVSVAAWVLAVNINTVFVVRALIRHVRRRKDGASPWSLGLREKKLWYCVLLTLVLMERFAFVYMLVFQKDPAAAFSSKMMGQHGKALLLSLVWPPQATLVLGAATVLALAHVWGRASGRASAPERANKRIVLAAFLVFFHLMILSLLLLHINRISTAQFYALFLFGKYFGLLAVILSFRSKEESAGQPDAAGTCGDGSPG